MAWVVVEESEVLEFVLSVNMIVLTAVAYIPRLCKSLGKPTRQRI